MYIYLSIYLCISLSLYIYMYVCTHIYIYIYITTTNRIGRVVLAGLELCVPHLSRELLCLLLVLSI